MSRRVGFHVGRFADDPYGRKALLQDSFDRARQLTNGVKLDAFRNAHEIHRPNLWITAAGAPTQSVRPVHRTGAAPPPPAARPARCAIQTHPGYSTPVQRTRASAQNFG